MNLSLYTLRSCLRGVQEYLYSFLISALYGSQWLASCSGRIEENVWTLFSPLENEPRLLSLAALQPRKSIPQRSVPVRFSVRHSDGYDTIRINIFTLKTKCNLLYKRNQSVPRCKHFPPQLMIYKAKVAVCSEIRKSTECEAGTMQNFFKFKPGGR